MIDKFDRYGCVFVARAYVACVLPEVLKSWQLCLTYI